MQGQAGLAKRAEQFLEDALLVASRLPRILQDLEQRQNQMPEVKAPRWPGIVALLALALAIGAVWH